MCVLIIFAPKRCHRKCKFQNSSLIMLVYTFCAVDWQLLTGNATEMRVLINCAPNRCHKMHNLRIIEQNCSVYPSSAICGNWELPHNPRWLASPTHSCPACSLHFISYLTPLGLLILPPRVRSVIMRGWACVINTLRYRNTHLPCSRLPRLP